MKETQFKRTTVTAALPYANGGVHIGHLAGVYVPADIYVRYLRLKKQEVMFVCGSDEHGVPITIRAKKEGITPQDVCDRYHELIKKSFEAFGISFDIYSRTTSPTHHQFASDFFKKLYDEGKLVEKETEQYYDEQAHQFLADRYIMGECPYCHNENAYGDQCERCGHDLSPMELINPHSTISGSKPVIRPTKNWYLPLNQYQPWLKKWILDDHSEWRSNVYGQCKSWLDMDLQPRAMTRDLEWGIPVPIKGAEGKVLYVWFDAPIGYISNTIELCKAHPERFGSWEKWWKQPDTRLVHFIGKDNIVFHCIIFPWRDFQERNNSELVAIYGNFVNRALQLTKKYWAGVVPACGELQDVDRQTLAEFADVKAKLEGYLDQFKFREAQKEAMNLARIGNKYITECEPWKVWKTDAKRVETILYISLQLVANLAIAFEPFLPFSSEKLRHLINMEAFDWAELGKTDLLKAGHQLAEPELLFEKLEDDVIQKQLDKLEATRKANETAAYHAAPVKETASFDDFEKLDIRVGHIKHCEKVKKSKKLLQFTIDDGTGVDRTILSGIAAYYEPEQLVGKDVLFVANFAPRTMMGIESQGMILSAVNADGALSVTTTLDKVNPGSQVG